MKKNLSLVLALLLALGTMASCGSEDAGTPENDVQSPAVEENEPAVEETEPEAEETEPEIEYEEEEDAFGSFDFSTLDTSLKFEDYANDWSGVVLGKTKEVAVEEGVGYNGSKGIAVYSIGTGADNDLDLKYEKDSSAILDWTGAEQAWFYIDGSKFGDGEFYANFAIQEQNADSDGTVNGSYQAWALAEGVVAHIYDVNANNGWVDVTAVNSPNTTWDPARLPLPAGFKGWVAVDIASLVCYWTSGTPAEEAIDLVYMNQFNWSVEGSEASVGGVCYVDSFSIVGAEVADGKDCPVTPMNAGAKWVEVWSLESFNTTEPKDTSALIAAANANTFTNISNYKGSAASGVKTVTTVADKGVNGSKALAVTATAAGADFDLDVFPTKDATYVSDWTGAEQIWFWLDASAYGTETVLVNCAFAEESLNADGALDGTSQAWNVTEGVVAHLYDTNKNEGWTDAVVVNSTATDWDPGVIPVPAGFVGWVAVDVSSMTPYWSNAELAEVFDLKNINQFNWRAETNESAVGSTLYLDSYAIVGKSVNGGECPVAASIEGAKFLEVWGFEGLDID